jgi:7-cyano-7-deazaguanine synthase in queuosine biosynthesis
MLRIRPHENIQHTLLIPALSELITTHCYRHTSGVHCGRCSAIEDRYAADTLYYYVDFGLDCWG